MGIMVVGCVEISITRYMIESLEPLRKLFMVPVVLNDPSLQTIPILVCSHRIL